MSIFLFLYLLISQNFPWKPNGHLHLNAINWVLSPSVLFTHMPPFLQILEQSRCVSAQTRHVLGHAYLTGTLFISAPVSQYDTNSLHFTCVSWHFLNASNPEKKNYQIQKILFFWHSPSMQILPEAQTVPVAAPFPYIRVHLFSSWLTRHANDTHTCSLKKWQNEAFRPYIILHWSSALHIWPG